MGMLDKYRKGNSKLMESILTKIDKEESSGNKDPRFFQLKRNSDDVGEAVIRFLPDVHSDEQWVKIIQYGFQSPHTGQWYIENSLKTIGKEDPVNDANRKLWATGNEEDEALARKRPPKTSYISNILVVRDKLNPENEGKVFLFKYGKSIFEFIKSALKPKYEDDVQLNPFSVFDGADFVLRLYKSEKNNQFTYDRSKFKDPSPISKDEDEIEAILNNTMDITEFIREDQFKPYDVLARHFHNVWNGEEDNTRSNEYKVDDSDDSDDDDDEVFDRKAPKKEKEPMKETKVESASDDEDDDDFFKD